MAKIKVKLPANNVISEIIEQFLSKNFDTIFNKYAGFILSYIRAGSNIIAGDNSLLNFLCNHLSPINVDINIVVDFHSDNSSSNKHSYLFNAFGSLSNYDYHKNNFNGGTISESDSNFIVLIKKRKKQQENKALITRICFCINENIGEATIMIKKMPTKDNYD